jgi:alcohol dehydrogenase class IV
MEQFVYQANPSRVIFGAGVIAQVPSELERLGLQKPLVLSTPQQTSQAEDVKTLLQGKVAALFGEATMHTPVEVTEKALEVARSSGADCVISVGGGSTIGLGKAISFRTGLYHLSIPTTYAGSEVTPILGETKDGRKTTISNPKVLPGTVIYDVDLTMTLPVGLTVTSGINAIAHAVEALYARNGNPIINLLAQEGVKALAEALPIIVDEQSNSDAIKAARSKALYGAWLCGTCLGSVGMSLHHKLCHTLGGSFNLPHAETHTVVLPHALAYNAPKVPGAMAALAAALPDSGKEGDAIQGLNSLLKKLGAPRDLKAFGMKEEDVAKAAEIAVSNPYWNPREVERSAIQELIRRAWAGEDAKANL